MSTAFADNFQATQKELSEARERIWQLEQDVKNRADLLAVQKQESARLASELGKVTAENTRLVAENGSLRHRVEQIPNLEEQASSARNAEKIALEQTVQLGKANERLTEERNDWRAHARELAAECDALQAKLRPFHALIEALKARRDADSVILDSLANL